MANYETAQYGEQGFFFGDNIAESGTLTADARVTKGTVLIRDSGKNWIPATVGNLKAGVGIGLAIADVEPGTAVACDVAISGKFNRNWVKVGDSVVTDAQADLLRGQRIIVSDVAELRK